MFELYLPGSKSITNRLLTLSGMSTKPIVLKNFLYSDDTLAGLFCLKQLGFKIQFSQFKRFLNASFININIVKIYPPDFKSFKQKNFYDKILNLDLKNSGTIARFFPAVILNWNNTFSLSQEIKAKFNANTQLSQRPILPFIEALNKLGADIKEFYYPFTISASDLSGKVEIDTSLSSQFLSGLLFVQYGSKNQIQISQTHHLPQPGYVDMTKAVIDVFHYQKTSEKKMIEIDIEPDASTACYYMSAAFLHNLSLKIYGLGHRSLQPDILFCDFLKKLGAEIEINEYDIVIHKRNKTGIQGGFTYDFSQISDQALTAGVLALFANEPIQITGISHIRHHESNRISTFVKNIKDFNLKIDEHEDGFTVYPQPMQFLKNLKGIWQTHDDHRHVMSGMLLHSMNSKIILQNINCVSKTSPTFIQDFKNFLEPQKFTKDWNS